MVRTNNSKSNEESAAFARHAQEDEALQPPDDANQGETTSSGLSMYGRIMVFIVFPITMGTIGLYIGYLESINKPDRKISFDQDFVMPFLLALAMSAILFFQTAGFTSNKVKPLVSWPKARRVKKIVKKKRGEIEADKIDYDSSSAKKNN